MESEKHLNKLTNGLKVLLFTAYVEDPCLHACAAGIAKRCGLRIK